MSELEIRLQALQRGLQAPRSPTYSLQVFRLHWLHSTWTQMFYIYSFQHFPQSKSLALLLWGQMVMEVLCVVVIAMQQGRDGSKPSVSQLPSTGLNILSLCKGKVKPWGPGKSSHWIAAVGTHPLGFINSSTNLLTATRDNYGFSGFCFLACWGNPPPLPLFPFMLVWAAHPLLLWCWAGSAASGRGNRFVNWLEINRQAVLPTQANLTLYAQHCIPLGWKSSFIPS